MLGLFLLVKPGRRALAGPPGSAAVGNLRDRLLLRAATCHKVGAASKTDPKPPA
jgi:hypothetical protein